MTCPRIDVTCAICGRRAATVELLLPGAVHPRASSTAVWDLGIYGGHGSRGSFILDGTVGKATWVLDADQLEQLQDIFQRGTWRALHDIDPEWLSSYCPACDLNYCSDHWRTIVEFDDDFYDCTRGTCPRGHSRILAD